MPRKKKSTKRNQPKKAVKFNRKPVATRKPSVPSKRSKRVSKSANSRIPKELLALIRYAPAKERKALAKKYALDTKKEGSRKRAITRKKNLKLPSKVKSSIIKHKNKKGRTYYYNHRTHRFSSGKSWKKSRSRVAQRNKEIEKIKSKKPRALTKWNILQRAVSRYAKENGLNLGKGFNRYVKNIYDDAKGIDANTLDNDIDMFFEKYSGYRVEAPEVEIKFKKKFKFFDAVTEFNQELYNDVTIIVALDDPYNSFSSSFEGFNDEFQLWYYSGGTFNHLRKYYGDSPPANFAYQNSDGKTFVVYKINIDGGDDEEVSEVVSEAAPVPDPLSDLPLTSKPAKEGLGKLTKKERDDIKKSAKSEDTKHEKKWVEYFEKLRSLGISDDDIKKIPKKRLQKKAWKLKQNQNDFIRGLLRKGLSDAEISLTQKEMNIKSLSKIMQEDIKFIDDLRKQGFTDEEIKKKTLSDLK